MHISKSGGMRPKCQFLGGIPGCRISSLETGLHSLCFHQAIPGILVRGQGQGSGPTLSFYKRGKLLLVDLMLIHFDHSFPGCKALQSHCGKLRNNEKIPRKLKSLIIPSRRNSHTQHWGHCLPSHSWAAAMRRWLRGLNPRFPPLTFYLKCLMMSLQIHDKKPIKIKNTQRL